MKSDQDSGPCPCGSGRLIAQCCGLSVRPAPIALVDGNGAVEEGALTPELEQALAQLDSPAMFPARIDFRAQRVRLVKMSAPWYEESVFLDAERIRGMCAVEMDLGRFASVCDALPWRASPYIFHSAFCGSTLMSQALAAAYNSLAIREPDVLGNVMFNFRDRQSSERRLWLERVMRVLGRRFEAEQPAVVKANDYANGLMRELLALRSDFRILFMYSSLADFVVACLKAPNRLPWIKDRCRLVEDSAMRLLDASSFGDMEKAAYPQLAAYYWCVNVALFLDAQRFAPQRVRTLGLDRMLLDPVVAVEAAAEFLELPEREGTHRENAVSRVFGVYSKNAAYKYSPRQRQEDVAELRSKFRAEIGQAQELAARLLGKNDPDGPLPGGLLPE